MHRWWLTPTMSDCFHVSGCILRSLYSLWCDHPCLFLPWLWVAAAGVLMCTYILCGAAWLVWCSFSGAVLLGICASSRGMRCYIWTGLVHPGLRWCKLSGWACLGMRWCTWPEAGLAGLAWCTWSGSAMHARLRWCSWSGAEAMHAGLQTATNSWINAVCS